MVVTLMVYKFRREQLKLEAITVVDISGLPSDKVPTGKFMLVLEHVSRTKSA